MIKINLCPREELENPLWWVGDVVVAVGIAAIGIFALQAYLESIQVKVNDALAEKAGYDKGYADLAPDLERFNALKRQKSELDVRLNSLARITVTKIEKFKPVIVLEHLQNLKPEGIWFTEIGIKSDGVVNLLGAAFDNILVAEFAMALRSTQNQDVEAADLRTQVHFERVALKKVTTTGTPTQSGDLEMAGYPQFEIEMKHAEKSAPTISRPGMPTPVVSQIDRLDLNRMGHNQLGHNQLDHSTGG